MKYLYQLITIFLLTGIGFFLGGSSGALVGFGLSILSLILYSVVLFHKWAEWTIWETLGVIFFLILALVFWRYALWILGLTLSLITFIYLRELIAGSKMAKKLNQYLDQRKQNFFMRNLHKIIPISLVIFVILGMAPLLFVWMNE